MPPSDRLQRLLKLVVMLQSGRASDSKELAELCGVSRRTIFRDLKVLQKSGIAVTHEGSQGGYSIPAATGIPSTEFSLDEALSMLLLCHSLGDETQGIPFLRSARSAALKLLGNLPGHLRDYLGELTHVVDLRLDARTQTQQDGRVYDLLTEAVRVRRQVQMTYRSLTENEGGTIETSLSPYRLLFARRAWYVIGRSSRHGEVRTFHVGRIAKAQLVDASYSIPERFSLEQYLGNAWFLIRDPGPDQNVVVRFQPLVAENVAEVQWHKTQRIVRNPDGTVDFHVTVSGIREIAWWILGYGGQAEVLSPSELRDELQRHAEAMVRRYAGSDVGGNEGRRE